MHKWSWTKSSQTQYSRQYYCNIQGLLVPSWQQCVFGSRSTVLPFAGAFVAGALQAAGEHDAGEDKWAETSEASLWGARRAHSRPPYWTVSVPLIWEHTMRLQTRAHALMNNLFLFLSSLAISNLASSSPVSHCCLRMKTVLCCLWEQRARG